MADINKLKDKIKSTIYPNGKGAINASDHQAMLLDMADGMAETDNKLIELSEGMDKFVRKDIRNGVTYAEVGGIATPNLWYVTPDMADGEEDDIILTELKTKTINGQSLLGKGNIEIESGTYDDTEIKNQLTELSEKVNELDKGEAYIMGDTLTFRNWADASIEGETLKL